MEEKRVLEELMMGRVVQAKIGYPWRCAYGVAVEMKELRFALGGLLHHLGGLLVFAREGTE